MFQLGSPPLARALRRLLLFAAIFSCALASAQPAAVARESSVKAAFLSKFAGFVEWPPGILAQPNEPLVVAVLDDDAVAADLQQIAAARSGDVRPIVVRRMSQAQEWSGAHVLFIGAGRDARVRELVSAVRGPVLIVTEQDAALRYGSVLNFSVDNGRVRFSASPAAAESRGLHLSARLLALASSVERER